MGFRPAVIDRWLRVCGDSLRRIAETEADWYTTEMVQPLLDAGMTTGRCWRLRPASDHRGSLRTFLLSLVHHRAVDTVRREERMRRRTERAANLERAHDEDVAEGVVEASFLAVRRKEVREALRTLPAEQRRVVELAYFGGYTQTMIADELEIPVGTVKTRTLAAMRKLRRALVREE